MEKIVTLHQGSVSAAETGPDESVVQLLESLLEKAKRAEIVGVGIAWIDPSGAVLDDFTGRCRVGAIVAAVTDYSIVSLVNGTILVTR